MKSGTDNFFCWDRGSNLLVESPRPYGWLIGVLMHFFSHQKKATAEFKEKSKLLRNVSKPMKRTCRRTRDIIHDIKRHMSLIQYVLQVVSQHFCSVLNHIGKKDAILPDSKQSIKNKISGFQVFLSLISVCYLFCLHHASKCKKNLR